jgi:hypothetical protein
MAIGNTDPGGASVGSGLISISVKGLAKYMTASATTARKVLRDFKYPDDEGFVQAIYYHEARDRIVGFHRGGRTVDWLLNEATGLETLAANSSGRTKPRLSNNAAALREYATHFGSRRLVPLSDIRMEARYGGVRVTIAPDMHFKENGRSKIAKLEFSREPPDKRVVAIISQTMFEAALARAPGTNAGDVLYMDVPRGKLFRGARLGARLARDIESTCKNIEAIWPTI